jgi:DNA-binding CsgD family transcriptional regulator
MTNVSPIDSADIMPLLRTVVTAASTGDHSHWCLKTAHHLRSLLNASALIVLDVAVRDGKPRITDFLDDGLANHPARPEVLGALNDPELLDPFLRRALRRPFRSGPTVLSSSDLPVAELRERCVFSSFDNPWIADSLISVAPLELPRRSRRFSAIIFFRIAPRPAFTEREKNILLFSHPVLADICAARFRRRPEHAAALSPRLRETLRHLSAGANERVIARKMNLSYHTVHDYVKALHSHFGVSSREDLIARWSPEPCAQNKPNKQYRERKRVPQLAGAKK